MGAGAGADNEKRKWGAVDVARHKLRGIWDASGSGVILQLVCNPASEAPLRRILEGV